MLRLRVSFLTFGSLPVLRLRVGFLRFWGLVSVTLGG